MGRAKFHIGFDVSHSRQVNDFQLAYELQIRKQSYMQIPVSEDLARKS